MWYTYLDLTNRGDLIDRGISVKYDSLGPLTWDVLAPVVFASTQKTILNICQFQLTTFDPYTYWPNNHHEKSDGASFCTMKIYLLTAVSFLFSLTAEGTVLLKLEGSCSESVCPGGVKNAVSDVVSTEVEATALDLGVGNRRQLRGIDERELTWCTDQGCYRNNPFQYCTIIGCPRRRDQTASGTQRLVQSTSTACPDLADTARAELDAQVEALAASNLANADACTCLFSNITITCWELESWVRPPRLIDDVGPFARPPPLGFRILMLHNILCI